MAELGGGYEDDSGYFAVLPTPPALLGGLELLAEAAVLARDLPFGQSGEIEALIGLVERKVTEAGTLAAKVADEVARDVLAKTRVRPQAPSFSGADAVAGGGARKLLEDGIRSEALGDGAVGVGSIEELDTVVGPDGRPFWRTQEHGSTHNVGRVVFGFFQPGSSLPSQQQFRQHAIFVAGPGGPMHIQRPIPARHFMRDGAAAAEQFRERQFREVEGVAVNDIRALRASLI